MASGAGPIAGLYGAVCVGFFAALFGGTPTLISEPTGPMTVVMTTIVASLTANNPENGLAMAFTVVMLAGIFQVIFGIFRLGKYIREALNEMDLIAAGIALYVKFLLMPNPAAHVSDLSIIEAVVQDSGVPNAVSGIIFRNRLYDTIFEVIVFTIAIMGVHFLLANERPFPTIHQFTDQPSIVLARLGATIAALVGVELAIRGHLTPGGGFAAGVAGGTAIALVAITSPSEWMESIYRRWYAATWEKISVLVFIVLAVITLIGVELPHGELGALVSGGVVPLLNILVAIKVALGSWAAILVFIRYRGLL